MSYYLALPLLSLFFFGFSNAVVPPSRTFKYVNEGEFGPYIVEYDGSYRVLPIGISPFQMAFYNTTPGEFTLALRMGTTRSESLRRWVWEANRGNPVGENATFSLGSDGNLVLAEADGHVVWQSNTVGKGVVGFRELPNGNMVLYDAKGSFVWQSFDTPTDTLLLGQSLGSTAPIRLVSRLSEKENKNGPYSLVLEPKRLAMYYSGPNSPKPALYADFIQSRETITNLTFTGDTVTPLFFGEPDPDDALIAYDLKFTTQTLSWSLSRVKYNATLTFLRLGIDGGLRAYTFYDKVDYGAWEETYTLFDRESGAECQLPERCGKFGICENSQCVACPSSSGLLGWSEKCAPPKLGSCRASDASYYKLDGVDHFTRMFSRGSGPIKEDDCRKKCTSDCKCAGFFYNQVGSRCWVVNDLMTLTKVANSTHLGYIKTTAK